MERESVLIIEDNRDMRTFLRDAVLQPEGYRVRVTEDGEKGLACALEEAPDLILLDLNMPRLSGLDVLHRLRKAGRRIPVIVISAYGSEETILQAFRLGAKDFLQKPFTMDEAQGAIENAMTEERLRREKENLTQALARANRRLQRQLENWRELNEIALTMTSTLEESEVLRRVIESVNRILRVEAGSLLLRDQEAGKLEFAATTKGSAEELSGVKLEPGQGVAGWVLEHGEPLIVPDVRQDARFFPRLDDLTGFRSQAIMCVPVEAQGEVIGVLEVINKRSGPESPSFTAGDRELLKMLAPWVAVAVENARLNRTTKELAVARTLGQAVTTLAHHINNRLMTLSLEMDRLESEGPLDQRAGTAIDSSRKCVQEISAVVKALDRLGEVRTVPYVGATEMIDIEGPLQEQLRQLKQVDGKRG